MDYIFRWLQLRFMTGQQQFLFENLRPRVQPITSTEGTASASDSSPQPMGGENRDPRDQRVGQIHAADALSSMIDMGDAPSCHVCGSIMVRNGSCYKCMSCGSTSGCS
jgi:ribonucleoside-diphosphate reductase alpha chain